MLQHELPSDDTTYYCSFHDAPQLDSKHHIVAVSIVFNWSTCSSLSHLLCVGIRTLTVRTACGLELLSWLFLYFRQRSSWHQEMRELYTMPPCSLAGVKVWSTFHSHSPIIQHSSITFINRLLKYWAKYCRKSSTESFATTNKMAAFAMNN